MTTSYWRVRVALPDRPGGLSAVAAAVADLGANVLDVDVHLLDSAEVADDLVLELPFWLGPARLERCLVEAGATAVSARRVDPHELVDSATRVLDQAAQLVRCRADDEVTLAALGSVLDADLVWFAPAELPAAGLVSEARSTRVPATGRAWVLRLSRGGLAPWGVAIPWGDGGEPEVVAARRRSPFSSTEIARAQSVLALAATVRSSLRHAAG